MGKIIITRRNDEGTFGTMTWDGGSMAGRLPPDDVELRAVYDRLIAEGVVPEDAPRPAVTAPDNPTLSDWRVGLTLWKRPDGTLRIDEVTKKVTDLVAAGHPMGRIARERLEYANNVLREQLMQLRGALGFSEAEVDESLWRADRVRQGDIFGVWPLPDA